MARTRNPNTEAPSIILKNLTENDDKNIIELQNIYRTECRCVYSKERTIRKALNELIQLKYKK